jgi:hypothetical protein
MLSAAADIIDVDLTSTNRLLKLLMDDYVLYANNYNKI